MEISAIPVITIICYVVAEAVKNTALDNKWLPLLCGVVGGTLGIVAMYVAPDMIPAKDVLTAFAIGIVSGFAATGVNQTYKQLEDK